MKITHAPITRITHTRDRFQSGSLKIEKRKAGDVWVYRWREYSHDGTSIYRKQIIGPVSTYKSKTAAQKAVAGMQIDINSTVTAVTGSYTVAELIAHFKATELAAGRMTARTISVYLFHLDKVLIPRWGEYRLQDVRTVEVERWLDTLTYAPATKNKAKTVLGTVYRHGMRYEWASTNPIALVRCSSKRESTPDILSALEVRAIVGELSEPARTMTLTAAVTGMRRGEIFGLKWQDISFSRGTISIVRSLVDNIAGEPKTEMSRKPLPMSPDLAAALSAWRDQTEYADETDWVFASPASFGKMPFWPDMVLRRHIIPAAKRLGILKRIGWHTFRRTAASLLVFSGASVKTTQELLRHASSDITLELYAQALSGEKREAQNVLAAMIVGPTSLNGQKVQSGLAA